MRPLHLLGLMPPEYRFHSPDRAPLMLPGSIPAGDQELIMAFFQQVITERPLRRVEVDWYTMLLTPSQRYLEHVLDEHGSSSVLLVVKVRQPGVDLGEVAEHPVIRAFEHLAITNVHPGGTEDLRPLLTLTHDIREHAEVLYEEMAGQLGLRADGWKSIEDFVRTLQSPIDVLETTNALIEVQLEGNPPDEQRDRILQRMLVRLVEWRAAGELVALIGLSVRGIVETEGLLGRDAASILQGLKAQDLLMDGELRQWARFLSQRQLHEGLFGLSSRLPTEGHLTEAWAERVREAMSWVGVTGDSRAAWNNATLSRRADADIDVALNLANIGKLSRAREILAAVELDLGGLSDTDLGHYWFARGKLEDREGAHVQAESSFRHYMRISDSTGNIYDRFSCRHALGSLLVHQNKAEEGESLLREALNLARTSPHLAILLLDILQALGFALIKLGRLEEAEEMLLEARQLTDAEGDAWQSRNIMFMLETIAFRRELRREQAP